TVGVSRSSWANLVGQVADAIEFLKEYEKALTTLRAIPGVDDIRLDFPVDLRIDRQTVMAQFDYFPPELVSRAGAIGSGLELSISPQDLGQLAEDRRATRSAGSPANEVSD